MDAVAAFSPDYVTSRRRFRAAAERLGLQVEALPIAGAGPSGEALTIDVAVTPAPEDAPALVLSSGLHGVEGFFGAAVQLSLLERWTRGPVPAVRCILIHGLNPYAFAWVRRCDENNVDLNRNFLAPGDVYRGSPPTYARLDSFLNRRRAPSSWEPYSVKAGLALLRYGMRGLRQAVAGGQYEYPRGLFFGGSEPATVQRAVAGNIDRWLGAARRVVHLDYHTGLGAWGEGKLLIGYRLEREQRQRLTHWFGANSFSETSHEGAIYQTSGDLGLWCVHRYPERDYLFACAEFGTYSPWRVLRALRQENQAHHYCQPGDHAYSAAKRYFRETFSPASAGWRRQVVRKSLAFVQQALDGLVPTKARSVLVGIQPPHKAPRRGSASGLPLNGATD